MNRIPDASLALVHGGFCTIKNDYGSPINVVDGLSSLGQDPFVASQKQTLAPGSSAFVDKGFFAGTDNVMAGAMCSGSGSYSLRQQGALGLGGSDPVLRAE